MPSCTEYKEVRYGVETFCKTLIPLFSMYNIKMRDNVMTLLYCGWLGTQGVSFITQIKWNGIAFRFREIQMGMLLVSWIDVTELLKLILLWYRYHSKKNTTEIVTLICNFGGKLSNPKFKTRSIDYEKSHMDSGF